MTVNLIWDFDGTLVQSSEAIRQALRLLYQTYQLPFDEAWVMDTIIQESIGQLLKRLAEAHQLDFSELLAFFTREQEARDHLIALMPTAKETLALTSQQGGRHFIVTHKGQTTQAVLQRLGIADYFTEVITADRGFKRKPDPEALLFLIHHYQMDKSQTYYIGDRPLDLAAARAAGISSINLLLPDSDDNHHISQLSDIVEFFSGKNSSSKQ
ncbi:TPA: HAD-IA family hydrolase [Streptococcus equi subsp. zooepidemicus]|nr:HAD-IA family hydrolase [Streptococcus equi subsp. zooepidemicus]